MSSGIPFLFSNGDFSISSFSFYDKQKAENWIKRIFEPNCMT